MCLQKLVRLLDFIITIGLPWHTFSPLSHRVFQVYDALFIHLPALDSTTYSSPSSWKILPQDAKC